MKFESIYCFFKYLIDNNIDLCKMDVELTPIDEDDSPSIVEAPLNGELKIFLEDLTDNPQINYKISNENILYVEDCAMRPFSCGTISIKLFGHDLLLNGCCKDENDIKTSLNIKINENSIKNVDFSVKKDIKLANTLGILEKIIYDHTGTDIKN